MPLQSGSDDVLRRMRRSYRSARYLAIIDEVRAALPDAAITTDIIVGFPGETEADFAATLEVVRAARFASAFTFQYSPRPGTPAAIAARPGAEGRRAGALRAAGRPAGRDVLGGQPRPGGPGRRGAGGVGGGPQGRGHAAAVGPGPRRSAGALHARWPGDPAGRRRGGRGDLRGAAPPRRRRPARRAPAHPGGRRRRQAARHRHGAGAPSSPPAAPKKARLWLFNWLKEPRHYSDYTIMPACA